MTVKVGSVQSHPLGVTGGCPQGSILGVFRFNTTINDLEAGCDELVDSDPAGTGPSAPGAALSEEDDQGSPPRTPSQPLASTPSRGMVGDDFRLNDSPA